MEAFGSPRCPHKHQPRPIDYLIMSKKQKHPIDGEQYLLIGDGSKPSIARGDSWEDSKIETEDIPESSLSILKLT